MLKNKGKTTLTYLFRAVFEDGTIIRQTIDDASLLPEGIALNKSAFFDVLEKEKESKLLRFSILNMVQANCWEVDLQYGIFRHNGAEFRATPEQFLPIPSPDYRLIYFRDVRRYQNNTFKIVSENEAVLESQEDVGYDIIYYIGWQTDINGKNYKQLLGVV